MNILQSLDAPQPFLVTLNRTEAIDPAKIIKRIRYEHPLFTPAAVAAQARQQEINGPLATYYCGAWWRNGFHEDGVVSALEALGHFGQRASAGILPGSATSERPPVTWLPDYRERRAHGERAIHRAA